MDELLKLLAELKATDEQKKAAKAAMDAIVTEATEEAVDGLKAKNTELLGKLKKAREASPDTKDLEARIDALESEKAELTQKAAQAEKAREKLEKDLTAKLSAEEKVVRKLVIDSALTEQLASLGVRPEQMEVVKTHLAGKAEVAVQGEAREAKIEGKGLKEYLAEWAATDVGKSFLPARASGAGSKSGTPGAGKAPGPMKRADFDALEPMKQSEHIMAGGVVED